MSHSALRLQLQFRSFLIICMTISTSNGILLPNKDLWNVNNDDDYDETFSQTCRLELLVACGILMIVVVCGTVRNHMA
jgi:hypothetical protein